MLASSTSTGWVASACWSQAMVQTCSRQSLPAGSSWKNTWSPSPATSPRWPPTASAANSTAAPTCHAQRGLEPSGEGERTAVESCTDVEHRRVADNHPEKVAAERRHHRGDPIDAPAPGNERRRALRHAGEPGRKRHAHREAREADEHDRDREADGERHPEEVAQECPEERRGEEEEHGDDPADREG